METLKFQGVKIKLDGKEYTMPALSPFAYAKYDAAKKIEKLRTEIKQMEATQKYDAISPEAFMDAIELVALALKRNYPDITEEDVGEGFCNGYDIVGLLCYLINQDDKIQKLVDEQVKNVQKQSVSKAK